MSSVSSKPSDCPYAVSGLREILIEVEHRLAELYPSYQWSQISENEFFLVSRSFKAWVRQYSLEWSFLDKSGNIIWGCGPEKDARLVEKFFTAVRNASPVLNEIIELKYSQN
jgi:hypothetical protein